MTPLKAVSAVDMIAALFNLSAKNKMALSPIKKPGVYNVVISKVTEQDEEKVVELSSHQGSWGGRRLTNDMPRFGGVYGSSK